MRWKLIDVITTWLLIAAGLTVALTAFGIDVEARLSLGGVQRKAVFGLIGVAALHQLLQWRAIRKRIRG